MEANDGRGRRRDEVGRREGATDGATARRAGAWRQTGKQAACAASCTGGADGDARPLACARAGRLAGRAGPPQLGTTRELAPPVPASHGPGGRGRGADEKAMGTVATRWAEARRRGLGRRVRRAVGSRGHGSRGCSCQAAMAVGGMAMAIAMATGGLDRLFVLVGLMLPHALSLPDPLLRPRRLRRWGLGRWRQPPLPLQFAAPEPDGNDVWVSILNPRRRTVPRMVPSTLARRPPPSRPMVAARPTPVELRSALPGATGRAERGEVPSPGRPQRGECRPIVRPSGRIDRWVAADAGGDVLVRSVFKLRTFALLLVDRPACVPTGRSNARAAFSRPTGLAPRGGVVPPHSEAGPRRWCRRGPGEGHIQIIPPLQQPSP
jgi:hypothetical protein